MYCTQVVWLEADALYTFKSRGFGEEIGMKMGVSHPFTYRSGTSNTGIT
jgi:hypothetical protein